MESTDAIIIASTGAVAAFTLSLFAGILKLIYQWTLAFRAPRLVNELLPALYNREPLSYEEWREIQTELRTLAELCERYSPVVFSVRTSPKFRRFGNIKRITYHYRDQLKTLLKSYEAAQKSGDAAQLRKVYSQLAKLRTDIAYRHNEWKKNA